MKNLYKPKKVLWKGKGLGRKFRLIVDQADWHRLEYRQNKEWVLVADNQYVFFALEEALGESFGNSN